MTNKFKYSFIGSGNMAKAIIKSLISSNISPENIISSDYNADILVKIKEQFNIKTSQNNNDCLNSEVIIIAVKPQVLNDVLEKLDKNIIKTQVFLSIVAGVSTSSFEGILGKNIKLIRTMPNTPAMIGEGITGIYANKNIGLADKKVINNLLLKIGKTIWVNDENKINIINAISGSGPAYFFTFIKLIAKSGEKLGLDYKDALELATQTAKGSAMLIESQKVESSLEMQNIINQVTSKGGTTMEALNSFKNNNLDKTISEAVIDCYNKALELTK